MILEALWFEHGLKVGLILCISDMPIFGAMDVLMVLKHVYLLLNVCLIMGMLAFPTRRERAWLTFLIH